jgi:beta-glucanase (GH16 family)
MMPTDEIYGGWPESGEIDIMENIGSEPSAVHGTLHFGKPSPNNSQSGGSYSLPSGQRFTGSFHVFAIEEPGVVRWIIDDVLFSTKTPSTRIPVGRLTHPNTTISF